jgi:hypothetical protein
MDCASGPYAETQIERSSQNLQSFNLMRCNRKIMISEFLGGEMECEKHPSTIHSLNYPIRSTVHRNRPRTNTRPFVRPFGLYTCPTMRFQTVYLNFKGPCKLFIPAFKAFHNPQNLVIVVDRVNGVIPECKIESVRAFKIGPETSAYHW